MKFSRIARLIYDKPKILFDHWEGEGEGGEGRGGEGKGLHCP